MSETTQTQARATTQRPAQRSHHAGALDIRNFIAVLIGFYGVVLLVTGLVATSESDLARAGGLNINLWAGVGMIVFAAAFLTWARMRPVVVPDEYVEDDSSS